MKAKHPNRSVFTSGHWAGKAGLPGFFFWPRPWHMEVPRPGIEPTPQQQGHRPTLVGSWAVRLEGWLTKLPLRAQSALTVAACSPQQLSGLLQVCVRTGTETQAKFTSVELLREYILVRSSCKRRSEVALAELMHLTCERDLFKN